jgi:hypothetical protein
VPSLLPKPAPSPPPRPFSEEAPKGIVLYEHSLFITTIPQKIRFHLNSYSHSFNMAIGIAFYHIYQVWNHRTPMLIYQSPFNMALGIAFYHICRVWNHRSSSELSINIHPLPDQRMPPKIPTYPKVYSIDHYSSELSINTHYGTWSWLLPHLPSLEPPDSSPSSELSIHIHCGT